MKNLPPFLLALWVFFAGQARLLAYSTEYLGRMYESPQPYNLNILYFQAADVPLEPAYHTRLSRMMLWLQNYYRQQMQANGYGSKTFGLYRNSLFPDSLRILHVQGQQNLDAYRNNGNQLLISEVEAFSSSHPEWIVSAHTLVIVAAPSFEQMNGLPYYGLGRTCYATDYPQLDLQYLNQTGTWGDRFVTYFGGLAHELGHGLNLPHSHQTKTENLNPQQGTSLMADGNYTLTRSPTFINRAGCAILNTCQVFAASPNPNLYNGHLAGLLSLHTRVQNGKWILSGRTISNRTVTDINFYQDPFATPSAGYARIAFSVPPVAGHPDSFYVEMPMTDVFQEPGTYPQTGPYNLEIELVLDNGETASSGYPYTYQAGNPQGEIGFQDGACPEIGEGWTLTDIGSALAPGSVCREEADSSYSLRSWGSGYDQPQSDGITYLHRPIGTSDTLVCRVRSVSPVWNDLVGLMIRRDLSPASPFASLSALDYRGVFWQWRSTAGGNSQYQIVTEQALPMWLRIARQGNLVRSWYSPDGQTWTVYASRNLSLPAMAYVGVVATKNGARFKIDRLWFSGNTPTSRKPGSEHPGDIRIANPVRGSGQLWLPASVSGPLQIRIWDALGRELPEIRLPSASGFLQVPLPPACVPGVYRIQIRVGEMGSWRKTWVVH